ncbi:hypothetical protein [Candidatus Harpocratesius sp.]
MIHFILVDTAIELVPKNIRKTPSFNRNHQKYGKAALLLDVALHHTTMNRLPNAQKRGRPDILHHFLLDCLGSPLNLHGNLRLHIHCPSGFFLIDSTMRCPRDYLRFKGLIAQLLELGHIPPKKPYLISQHKDSFNNWISSNFSSDRAFLLTEKGPTKSFNDIQDLIGKFVKMSQDVVFLIGGFQKGDFSTEIQSLSTTKISWGNHAWNSWTVVNHMLVISELALDLI